MKTTPRVLPFLLVLPAGIASGSQSPGDLVLADSPKAELAGGGASDGTDYLIGISGDSIVPGRIGAWLVTAGGTVKPLVATGRTGGIYPPLAAYGGALYLLVWTDAASAPDDDIYGQLFDPSGAKVGAAIAISQAPAYEEIAGVAYGGGRFLVTYRLPMKRPIFSALADAFALSIAV